MVDPISLAVLTTNLAGLLMRGAAVAVDPSWSSAAALPADTLNTWRSLRGLLQGRDGKENPLEASIKGRLQKQVDTAREQYTKVTLSALNGAVTEMEVALTEIGGDDDAVVEAVRFPDNFETYLRRRTAGRRKNVEAAAEPFFDDLTCIVAEEFIRLAPGSRSFDLGALKQLLAGQERLVSGQDRLIDQYTKTYELLDKIIDSIDNIRSTRTQIHATPKRIRFGSRPTVTTNFIPRAGQNQLINAIFTQAKPRTVLTGMRGSGKTQLAAAIAAKCEDKGWPVVAWINAASRKELIADLYEVAIRVGIDAPKDVPPSIVVRRCLDELSAADVADRLFVFDNVENLDDLKNLTPHGDGIRVIVTTTRHLDWESLGWHPITVGVFEREQSIALLCERTADADRNAADQVADALGDLPVAVTQAAATAKSGGYTLSDYLERLSNHPLESSISRLEGDDYPDAVGIALFMAYEQTLEQIRTAHPQQERIATSLLSTLSLLAASGVPSHWLLHLDDDSDTVRSTLSFLRGNSIVQESSDDSKTLIHRLQGQVYHETYLSNQEKITEATRHATTVLNEINIERLADFKQERQKTRDLTEQIRSVASQDYSYPLFSDPDFVLTIATTLKYATILGMPQLALTLAESVTQAGEALGLDHPGTLASRGNLAGAYQEAGRLNEAIALYEQTFEDTIRILGPDHPGTLASRGNLAYAYQEAGRLNEAIALYEQNLTDHTRILGPDHPDTLASRGILAGAYQEVGRLDETIALYEQTFEDTIRILGPDYPVTLASRGNLAYAYQEAGRLNEAITLYRQNLKDSTRILGPNHPHTLASRHNLAYAYQEAGRLNEAIALHEQNLEDSTRILGPNHPHTLASRHNLANAYQAAGRLDEAIDLHEQNLEDRTHILGPNHPHTLTTRNNLANAYQAAGRLDEAITLFEQTLTDRTRILGPDHPHTLTTRNNLANAYRAAGRFEDADKLFETPSDSEEDEQDGAEDDPDQETGD